jgi:hypothetical protein
MTMLREIDDDGYEFIPEVDQEALERAVKICLTLKPVPDRLQMENKLAAVASDEAEWWDVATFAAYSCQMDALRLKPWQKPPCWIDDVEGTLAGGNKDDIHGCYAAAVLLKRLLAAGLSMYEPDPLGALKAVSK